MPGSSPTSCQILRSKRGDRILWDLNISIGSDKNRVGSDRFFVKDVGFRWNPTRIRSKTIGSTGGSLALGRLFLLLLFASFSFYRQIKLVCKWIGEYEILILFLQTFFFSCTFFFFNMIKINIHQWDQK